MENVEIWSVVYTVYTQPHATNSTGIITPMLRLNKSYLFCFRTSLLLRSIMFPTRFSFRCNWGEKKKKKNNPCC